MGRLIFNENIPQDLGYVDRTNSENEFALEIDFIVKEEAAWPDYRPLHQRHGTAITAEMLDKIKALGFKYSTKGAITVAVCDAAIPPQKKQYLAEADAAVEEITDQFNTRPYLQRRALSAHFADLVGYDHRSYRRAAGQYGSVQSDLYDGRLRRARQH